MADKKVISGIQQIGIGVRDVDSSWKWYREHFGMDIEVFDEEAVAELMIPHTNNKPIPRRAVLALNMQGGGGFEIWQQTKYKAVGASFELKIGDLGIFLCKIKCRNVVEFHKQCLKNDLDIQGNLSQDPLGRNTFFLNDPNGNVFQIVESDDWFKNENRLSGGTYGTIIGVSDIEKAMVLYKDILGHDKILYDEIGVFEDLGNLNGGGERVRRVLLRNSTPRKGAFGKFLSTSEIELVQCIDRETNHIFKERIWGDLGYIHLCFDVHGMDHLKKECAEKNFAFTVDSADSFDMGVAAGRFSYVQDPDGTLIEFVETDKVPIIKKIGWYMNLENFGSEKYLPNWMVHTLAWKRKKD